MRRYEDSVLARVTDAAGVVRTALVPSATVDVFLENTTTPATIYSDEGTTTKTNPLTTDSEGRFWFYVSDGIYDLRVTGTGITTYTQESVEIIDVTGAAEDSDTDWKARVLNNVRFADQFEGANAGAKIAAAITDLPATGGTVDARGLEGAQTLGTALTDIGSATKFVRVILGAGTYTQMGQITIHHQSQVVGQGRAATKIIAHSSFPVSTAMWLLGAAADSNSFAVRMENMEINANDIAGSICVQTTVANEQSGLEHVVLNGYRSKGFHALTGPCGSYHLWDVECLCGPSATGSIGIHLAAGSSGGVSVRQATVNTNNAGQAQQTAGVEVDDGAAIIETLHVENHADGVLFSGTAGATGTVSNYLGASNVTTGVRIASSLTPIYGITLLDIRKNGGTNCIKNDLADFAHTLTEERVAIYALNTMTAGTPRLFTTGSVRSDHINTLLLRGSNADFQSLNGSQNAAFSSGAFGTAGAAIGTISNHELEFYTNSTRRAYFLNTGALVPHAVGGNFGSSSLRWDINARSADFTGAITPTGGLAATGRSRYSTVPIGSVAYASFGTDTTPVNGTIYWAEVYIPRNVTLTGVAILNGSVAGGTNKYIVALYNSAGTLVANSALAGTATSGANAFQLVNFTATYAAVGPARFWIAVQLDGGTDKFRSIAASTFIEALTTSTTGTFGTLTALTPPATFTADVGPIAYVYV